MSFVVLGDDLQGLKKNQSLGLSLEFLKDILCFGPEAWVLEEEGGG